MTDPVYPPAVPSIDSGPVVEPDPRRPAELRAAVAVFLGLAVLGAVLGLVWSAWSPPGPRALVLSPGAIVPDETEAWVAADGRYAVLTLLAGLVVAVLAWSRVALRGAPMLLALAAGGLAGAALTWAVGRLTGGGTADAPVNTLIDQLPLTVHMNGLLFLQAGVSVLAYGMLAAFAARDDLGRPDPVRDRLVAALVTPPPSVGAGDEPQYSRGYGDAAGALQQRDLPPQ